MKCPVMPEIAPVCIVSMTMLVLVQCNFNINKATCMTCFMMFFSEFQPAAIAKHFVALSTNAVSRGLNNLMVIEFLSGGIALLNMSLCKSTDS